MRKMTLLLLAIGGMVLSLLVPTMSAQAATQADESPPPGLITLDLTTVNGSGCPAGTAAVAVAPDHTAFTVTYSDYTAKVGPNVQPTDRRVNCQLSMLAHVPQGFTYAITSADYRGYANLAKGAWGLEKASYYFQGSPGTVYRQHRIDGATDDNFEFTDDTPIAALVWAPCGALRNFNVNTELRVNAGSSDPSRTPSYLTMDSTDLSVHTIYHLAWKHC